MRITRKIMCALGAGLITAITTGCFFDDLHNCDVNMSLACFYQGGGAGGSGGTGGTGGTGGAPPSCIPANNGTPVDDSCGVFVSASRGNDSGDGSKEAPFATIDTALGKAAGKPVYLCAETFTEALKVGGGAQVYGGLDCAAQWKYVGDTTPTELTAAPDEIPLHVTAKRALMMSDVSVRAADAKQKGGSSIALLAEGEADVMLTRCTVEAGKGANGADGEPFANGDTGAAGQTGIDGGLACSADQVITPLGPTNECGDIDSIGGSGGNGQPTTGAPGAPGDPFVDDNGGTGENAMNACQPGFDGAVGMSGGPGSGATTLGLLKADGGFIGAAGNDGKPGASGQGGGGGGGAKGGMAPCTGQPGKGGASGGSGGSGGCGGLGGKGGGAGGASIAIASLGATFTFSDVSITAKSGGNGGNGGLGQTGGAGGLGGNGGTVPNGLLLNAGCAGGQGGDGGKGGQGGGGRGGHSLGIAHTGTAPIMEGATITTGKAGDGGMGDGPNGNGAAGVAQEVKGF